MGLPRSDKCNEMLTIEISSLIGLIISDWTGVYSTVESLNAGVDLEMPYVTYCLVLHSRHLIVIILFSGPSVMRGPALLRMLMAQKITLDDIDKRVSNVSQKKWFPFIVSLIGFS